MQQQLKHPPRPWYRERIAWALLAGPLVVVFAGFATYYIAFKNQDPLVVDDYYKQGLHINQELGRSQAAHKLGLKAQAMFSDDMKTVRVVLQGQAQPVDTLTLRLVHPTREHHDQTILLKRGNDGLYQGSLMPVEAQHWFVRLEDNMGQWLIEGAWYPEQGASVALDPNPTAGNKSNEATDN